MRRADRLMQIIQLFLRRNAGPGGLLTAAQIAAELEVSERTVYRDIADLTANGVPIRGEAGLGYVMDEGYNLPPLMFTGEELEALMLGARMVGAEGDAALATAARDALAKISKVLPPDLKARLLHVLLFAPPMGEVDGVDVAGLRLALREHRKIAIQYEDAEGAIRVRHGARPGHSPGWRQE